MYLQLKRTQEELERLNIEVRRLRTSIHDEGILIPKAIDSLLLVNVPLATELKKQWSVRSMVNALHIGRLDRIEGLDGFSGVHGVGVRAGGTDNHMTSSSTSDPVVEEVLRGELERAVLQDDDEILDEIQGLTDFVSSI